MAINFPDNRDQLVPPQPSGPIQTGDVYVYLGTTYTATVLGDGSVRWDAAVSAGSDAYVLKVGDTMTGQLTLPGGGTGSEAATVDQITSAIPAALWQRDGGTSTLSPATANDNLNQGSGNITTTGNLGAAAGTFSGDVSAANFTTTGNVQTASLNSGPLAGFRNQLSNPSFEVTQRGGGTVSGQVFTGADRWYATSVQTTAEVRTMTAGTAADVPWSNFMRISSTGTGILNQCVELPAAGRPGPFVSGSVWTLSWYTQQDLTDISVLAGFTPSSLAGIAVNHSVTAPSLTGETVGTFSRVQVQITIDGTLGATDEALRVLIAGSNSKTFDVAHAQLELGSVPTPVETRPLSTELAICERYFQLIKTPVAFKMINGATGIGVVDYRTTMRAVGTVPSNGDSGLSIQVEGGTSSGFDVNWSPQSASVTALHFAVNRVSGTAFTAGSWCVCNSIKTILTVDAEL